jgi:hypothetical protein
MSTEVLRRSEHFAGHLRETAAALFLNASFGQVFKDVDTVAYKLYRDRLLADCGAPSDPIEVILIEQISMAHLITGYLHTKGLNSSAECASAYLGAAARLTGELRRSALALQTYRAASVRLAEMADANPQVPTGEVIEHHDEPLGDHVDGEIGATAEDDTDGPTALPFQRRASV